MYRLLRRRFKVHGCVGDDFTSHNGILQGCALSVIALNALMAVWDKLITTESECDTGLYADDSKLLARSVEQLSSGLDLSAEFSGLTGLTFGDKSVSFTTQPSLTLQLTLGEQTLRQVTGEVVDLKAPICLRARTQRRGILDDRFDREIEAMKKLDCLNLDVHAKSQIVMTKHLSACMYGIETGQPLMGGWVELRKTVTRALDTQRTRKGQVTRRCGDIVLAVLLPVFRAEPGAVATYRSPHSATPTKLHFFFWDEQHQFHFFFVDLRRDIIAIIITRHT